MVGQKFPKFYSPISFFKKIDFAHLMAIYARTDYYKGFVHENM